MRRLMLWTILAAGLAVVGCKTTRQKEIEKPLDEGEPVVIPPGELEPMAMFLFDTKRVLVGEFVRVEASTQFFEEKMGFTRDLQFVERTQQVLPDGTRLIELKNINTDQLTNRDPDLLPRVYFDQGLEIRAYHTIRIYLRRPTDRKHPLWLKVDAKSNEGNTQMWVTGRLQYDQPTVRLSSELIWNEERERYDHRSGVD